MIESLHLSEDTHYVALQGEIEGFVPIQTGSFLFENIENDEDFVILAEHIGNNIERFVKEKLPVQVDNDDVVFGRMAASKSWSKEFASATKVVVARYVVEERSILIALNHQNVGGGDYLLLGVAMFNGMSNELLPNLEHLDDSWRGWMFKKYCSLRLQTCIVIRQLLCPFRSGTGRDRSAIRTARKHILACGISVERLNRTAGSAGNIEIKTKLVYHILRKITHAMGDNLPADKLLLVSVPMAFMKTESSPNNNIGILCFPFRKTMSVEEMQSTMEAYGYTLYGSHFSICESQEKDKKFQEHVATSIKTSAAGKSSLSKGDKLSTALVNLFKQRIDITITAARVSDPNVPLNMVKDAPSSNRAGMKASFNSADIKHDVEQSNCILKYLSFAHGGMTSMMDEDVIFPSYVWCLSAGDTCYVSYSIADSRIDMGRLKESLEDECVREVTEDQIYFDSGREEYFSYATPELIKDIIMGRR